jgi:multiple sugar transport system substrate-binding protein
MKAKRKGWVLAAVLTLAATAALAGSTSAGAKPSGSAAGKATTITIWVMNNGAHPVEDMERIVAPFEASSGIGVDVQLVGWDVQFQRITNAAISGQGPDVTQAGTTQVPYFSALGGFENLASRIKEIGGRKAYTTGAWTTTQVYGKPGAWSVPWFSEARAIYYRTDIYKRAGINPKTAFTNWAAFKRTLTKLKSVSTFNGRKVAPFGSPGKSAWDLVHHVMPFVWGAGGTELNLKAKRSAIDSPQAIRGVKYFADLAAAGLMLPSALERNAPQVENQFKGGEIATWIGGPWVIAAAGRSDDTNWVADARANFSTAALPVGPSGKFYTFFGGSNLMMFKNSSHKAEAWRLIKFLSQDNTQLAYARLQGMFPARVVPQKKQSKVNKRWANFYTALTHGRTYAPVSPWGPIENAYKTHFGNILDIAVGQGKVPYSRDAVISELKAAAREANSLLRQTG